MDAINWIISHGPALVGALDAVIMAVIAICLFVPGDQPEAFLQQMVDFLRKLSRKAPPSQE